MDGTIFALAAQDDINTVEKYDKNVSLNKNLIISHHASFENSLKFCDFILLLPETPKYVASRN